MANACLIICIIISVTLVAGLGVGIALMATGDGATCDISFNGKVLQQMKIAISPADNKAPYSFYGSPTVITSFPLAQPDSNSTEEVCPCVGIASDLVDFANCNLKPSNESFIWDSEKCKFYNLVKSTPIPIGTTVEFGKCGTLTTDYSAYGTQDSITAARVAGRVLVGIPVGLLALICCCMICANSSSGASRAQGTVMEVFVVRRYRSI